MGGLLNENNVHEIKPISCYILLILHIDRILHLSHKYQHLYICIFYKISNILLQMCVPSQIIEAGTNQPELDTIAKYYFDGQGKALRPMVAMLMARAINYHIHKDSR